MRNKYAPLSRHRQSLFGRFAKWIATVTGHPSAFGVAVLLLGVWLVTGPMFNFSNTWQLVVNTGTTIVTFLMVFLIQNTQNRDSVAMQIKLDELIRTDNDAHNALLDLEELTEEQLIELRDRYEELAEKARKGLKKGKRDRGIPEVF